MNLSVPRPRIAAIAAATLLALGLAPAWAQEMDHSMHQPVELTAPAQEAPEPPDLHAGHQMPPAEPVEQEREQPVNHSMHAPAEQAPLAPETADPPVDPPPGTDTEPAPPTTDPLDH